ncbi:EAL domain-containing protein [Erwinia sorbitola]|uniref:cyclic-guanylate-specific phosphodiesterase n=1 Tax=Erwinia sorbitola TaxID=2681984 RepID=A0A6I6EP05_9GAMM|nr:EAL domain-containing protein [Erwinia sorbitola]QGU85903.1 EAL domain-containing protein [Erwinia sorbitola]
MQAFVKPKHDYFWLTVAGILPLLLCLVFTFLEARNSLIHQQKTTASTLIDQAEHVSQLAWEMTSRLRQFNNRQCADIRSQLQRYGTLYPYFRSVGLTHGDEIYCSSAFGSTRATLDTMLRGRLPGHHLPSWMLSLPGTFGVKDRPAVVYSQATPDGFSSYAVVEGQYLIDFMTAIGLKHGYHITMQFGGGYRIASGKPLSSYEELLGTSTYTTSSDRYAITVSLTTPRSEALHSWLQVLFTFLPMAIILSLLFMMVTNSWLKRKSSFRDDIRRGIDRDEFTVNYQPVYNQVTGCLSGAESLLRWQRPNGSWVRPDIFIAAAEDEGMIIPLTRHLLQLVAKDCVNWQVPPGFNLGINVAAEHLQDKDFVADIRQFALDVAHLNATITLELTERSLIRDGAEVGRKLTTLRNEGMKVAIDDFGTGHCSLTYLQTFPLDYLKIDKGFVNAIESVDGETPVLDAIIMLADKLALKVVAEGVENAVQMEYLKRHSVMYIQGYYYAKPMDNTALMQWIAQQNAAAEPSL